MVCGHCRCVFCWDDADQGALGGYRKDFCSRGCKVKGKRKRARHRTADLRAQAAPELDRLLNSLQRRHPPAYASRKAGTP